MDGSLKSEFDDQNSTNTPQISAEDQYRLQEQEDYAFTELCTQINKIMNVCLGPDIIEMIEGGEFEDDSYELEIMELAGRDEVSLFHICTFICLHAPKQDVPDDDSAVHSYLYDWAADTLKEYVANITQRNVENAGNLLDNICLALRDHPALVQTLKSEATFWTDMRQEIDALVSPEPAP